MEMSKLLNTGLDADTLALCVRLCENGVNPEALALVIQELRRESAAIKVRLISNLLSSLSTRKTGCNRCTTRLYNYHSLTFVEFYILHNFAISLGGGGGRGR